MRFSINLLGAALDGSDDSGVGEWVQYGFAGAADQLMLERRKLRISNEAEQANSRTG
jgi:hypothetical protein